MAKKSNSSKSPSAPKKAVPIKIEPTPKKQTTSSAKTAPELSGKLLYKIDTEPSKPSSSPVSVPVSKQAKQAKAETVSPESTDNEQSLPETGTTKLDDQSTDDAVDEIAANEADTMLALQDARNRNANLSNKSGWKYRISRILKSKWTWLTIGIIIIVLLAIPTTRYKLVGFFVKEQVTVSVKDSTTKTSISSVTIQMAGQTGKTNAEGRVKLKVPPGGTKIVASKRYYQTSSTNYFVKLKSSSANVELKATGRQIPVTVTNKITGQPLANVSIKALNTVAKTNRLGQADLVVPAKMSTVKATLGLPGYNSLSTNLQVTNQVVAANSVSLVPSGQVYFLESGAGQINVVKANLDGSSRQVVLSGNAAANANASLSASTDWKYVAVRLRDNSSSPTLYLINTGNGKITQFESGNATYNLIGWYRHNFMYQVISNSSSSAQTGHEQIKSYDADRQQLNQLDQNQADGLSYQHFYNFYVMNNLLTYNTQWYGPAGSLAGKNASIRGVQPDGQNKKDYQQFPSAGLNLINIAAYQPQAVYYRAHNDTTGQTTYYNFANQTVNSIDLNSAQFTRTYPAYFTSPSGKQTAWADPDSGNVFVGNASAGSARQATAAGRQKTQGWYGDNYVLVVKDSQLAITAAAQATSRAPIAIGKIYQPPQTFHNYGYSYGP